LPFGESMGMIEREEEGWKSMMDSMHDASHNSQVWTLEMISFI
jgi:hypothetical protein